MEQNTTGDPVLMSILKERLVGCDDAVYADVYIGERGRVRGTLVFIDGMVQSNASYDYILKPLAQDEAFAGISDEKTAFDLITHGHVYHGQQKICDTMTAVMSELLYGSALLVFDGLKTAVAFDVKGFEKRGITEPTNESVLKGSKEGFVEVLRTNTALMRRRIQSNDLKAVQLRLGRRTHTTAAIMYMAGIANDAVINEVRRRLELADVDGIAAAGQIETILYEKASVVFPQLMITERPDRLSGNLLEGRVGIIVDGLPMAFIVPIDLNSLLQAGEDYSAHFILSSLTRLMRYICAFAALMLPAFYVAVTTFHYEMIPTKLTIAIIASKQGVPFPSFMEVLLMLVSFEVLMEAGLRLPQAVGQAVSIVGALVVGQAAITAHILSPGVVIVIAAAGITGFVVPNQDLSRVIRALRVILVGLATIGGLFLTSIGLILILYYLCALETFGTPYVAPIAGNSGHQMVDDTVIWRGWRNKHTRPSDINPINSRRQRRG